MANNLDWYLDRAKENMSFSSDRKLNLALGYSGNSIVYMRKKGVLPSPEKMVKISELAGIDPAVALMDFAIWNSDGKAKKTYATILQKITQTTAIVVLFLTSIVPYSANAASDFDNNCKAKGASLYLMERKGCFSY